MNPRSFGRAAPAPTPVAPPAGPEPSTPASELAELRRANSANPLNIAATRAWVGTDPARAQAALTAERAEREPRTSLIAFLEGLVR